MSSEEDSDDELMEEQWPDDYFDIDCDEYTPKPQHVPMDTSFDALPMDALRLIVGPLGLKDRCRVLRCNRALCEAVSTSTWSNIGNGKLIVTAVEKDMKLFVQVGICGLHTIRHDGDFEGDLARYTRLGEKLHLNELRLNNVPLEDQRLRIVNDFIDEHCIFDKLTIMRIDNSPLSDRARQLMGGARGEVVLEMQTNEMNDEEMLSIERPVKIFLEERAMGFRRSFLHEEMLMELVRRGHSIIDFQSEISSPGVLNDVIERVSSSPTHQKVHIHITDFSMVKSYVQAVEAAIEYGPHGNVPGSGLCLGTNSYYHLGANIRLAKFTIPPRKNVEQAVVIVKSVNYPEDPDEYTPIGLPERLQY